MRPPVYIGLGSNLGDRERFLEEALRRLSASGFSVRRRSSNWLTEPVGGPPQGWYLNAVAGGEAHLEPKALLDACLTIERDLGRVRSTPNAARTIDLDLLLFSDLHLETPALVLPHPRMHERRFVLAPLAEIAPDLVHPTLGRRIKELLGSCPDRSRVERQARRESDA